MFNEGNGSVALLFFKPNRNPRLFRRLVIQEEDEWSSQAAIILNMVQTNNWGIPH